MNKVFKKALLLIGLLCLPLVEPLYAADKAINVSKKKEEPEEAVPKVASTRWQKTKNGLIKANHFFWSRWSFMVSGVNGLLMSLFAKKGMQHLIYKNPALQRGAVSKLIHGMTGRGFLSEVSKNYKVFGQSTVRDILQKAGINPEDVLVVNSNKDAAIGNVIMFNTDAPRSHQLGALCHEVIHVKNRHALKRALFALVVPYVTDYILKKCDQFVQTKLSALQKNLSSESSKYKAIDKAKKISHWMSAFCLTKFALSMGLHVSYCKFQEMEADVRGAMQHKNACQSLTSFFEDCRQNQLLARQLNPVEYGRAFDSSGNSRFDFMHPKLTTRIWYLKILSKLLNR